MPRLSCLLMLSFATMTAEPSLIFVNARVWTGNKAAPWAEAIAVEGERITGVGTGATVRQLAGKATRIIDASGRMIVPGFIDTHVHFVEGGFRLQSVQLRDAKTKAEFVRRVSEYARRLPAGEWVTGGDWDHSHWGGELPTRDWIDAATGERPVWINRLDGHMALANSAALAAAKVTRDTKDVAGGEIVRDRAGNPTGVLKDNAMSLVGRIVPKRSADAEDRALDAAMQFVSARGVTSVHNMGRSDDVTVFDRARSSGRLTTRIFAAVPLANWRKLADMVAQRGRGDHWLRIGGLKGYVDGSLGSHTALFHQPYTDSPKDTGLLVNTPENLYEWTSNAAKNKLHVMVHAIGDRAITLQLDIFERVAREQKLDDPRFRIEHAQHIALKDIARFGKLGVIPSMQPYHCIDDGRWAEPLIGPDRAKGTYAFRALIDTGARPAFGSDWYVAPPTPLEGIYAAVTRATLDDKRPSGWVPEQKITVEEALRAYTISGAYASFEEKEKGSIEKGKLADLVMLERDITRIPPHSIRDVKVLMTVVGGRIVHDSSTKQ